MDYLEMIDKLAEMKRFNPDFTCPDYFVSALALEVQRSNQNLSLENCVAFVRESLADVTCFFAVQS